MKLIKLEMEKANLVTISKEIIKDSVYLLLTGKDYRKATLRFIEREFFNYTLKFFKIIINKKLNKEKINIDLFSTSKIEFPAYTWYSRGLIDENYDKQEIANHSGLNLKTINNLHNSSKKEIVLDASREHLNELIELIEDLTKEENSLNIELTLTYNDVSIKLDLNETLIVINALAVARSTIRGGAYSSIGFQIEKPLMLTLCKILKVPSQYYENPDEILNSNRQIDFFFKKNRKIINCEIKLMGKGNPESFDAALARDTHIFIANKISDKGKEEMKKNNVYYLEFRDNNNLIEDFAKILDAFEIPFEKFSGNYKQKIKEIIETLVT